MNLPRSKIPALGSCQKFSRGITLCRGDDTHFPKVDGEFRTADLSPLHLLSSRDLSLATIFSYLAAEPGSSLQRRRSQDRVRGERRCRLVEQMRLRRGPSSEINGRRGATGRDARARGREEKKVRGKRNGRGEEGRSSAEE